MVNVAGLVPPTVITPDKFEIAEMRLVQVVVDRGRLLNSRSAFHLGGATRIRIVIVGTEATFAPWTIRRASGVRIIRVHVMLPGRLERPAPDHCLRRPRAVKAQPQ